MNWIIDWLKIPHVFVGNLNMNEFRYIEKWLKTSWKKIINMNKWKIKKDELTDKMIKHVERM